MNHILTLNEYIENESNFKFILKKLYEDIKLGLKRKIDSRDYDYTTKDKINQHVIEFYYISGKETVILDKILDKYVKLFEKEGLINC